MNTVDSRPRFRGVSHRFAFFVALAGALFLVMHARDARAAVATGIYGVLLAGMFGVSATLHRAVWSPRTFGWLRRADHAMIFAFIAGTYTPLCMVGIGGPVGTKMLAFVWIAAAFGIVRALCWPHAPRVITAVLYLAVGWIVLAYLPEVRAALPPVVVRAIFEGGVAYTLGAAVYASRWPNPWPKVFGYHEVFHALIIIGGAYHFVAVACVVVG